MIQNSSPQSRWQTSGATGENRALQKPLVISVWVVPIIVGVVLIFASLIVAALLLGNQ
jgi:hypothetical protein